MCIFLFCLSQGGVRVAYTEALFQFGNTEGVDPGAIDRWLAASGTLELDPPSLNALREADIGNCAGDSDEGERGEDDAARYDCGLESCHKTFAHNHFLAGGGGGLPEGFHQRL